MNPAEPERHPEATGDEQEPDYRFTLANERTFLAWIRTALALIAGGVAVVQLVPAFGVPGVRHALGVLLTAGGGVLAALGGAALATSANRDAPRCRPASKPDAITARRRHPAS